MSIRVGIEPSQFIFFVAWAALSLELLQPQVWAHAPDVCRNQDHKQRPIDAKERQKWLTSLEAVIAARGWERGGV